MITRPKSSQAIVKKSRRKKRKRTHVGKGSAFERKICKLLSRWVSHGKRDDVFWRTAMSGGRATFMRRKGVNIRQAGDICAVAGEGHALTDHWMIECKHRKSLEVSSFLISGTGSLARFWKKAVLDAKACDRQPMLIACQNHLPIIVVTHIGKLERYTASQLTSHARNCDISLLDDMLTDKFPEDILQRIRFGEV